MWFAWIAYIVLILIIFIGLCICLFFYQSGALATSLPLLDVHDNYKYYKCPGKEINKATLTGLEKAGFIKGNNPETSELYIPCGYNYVELELLKLEPGAGVKYIYAIKGCDLLCSKNMLWSLLKGEYGIDIASNIMPLTWIFNDKTDYNEFQRYYLQYSQNRPTFILKKNIQGKRGLYITRDKKEIDDIYNSKTNDYKVIQRYVDNIYTIQDYKLNIRLYVVIVCVAGRVDWYLYNYGKCIYTNKKYDPVTSLLDENLLDKEQHFTSYNLDTDEKYIKLGLPESLADLEIHMGSSTYNKVWHDIKLGLGKIKKCFNGKLCLLDSLSEKVCFQLFGVDVILNELTPLILEFNKGPEMIYKSRGDKKLKNNLVSNMLLMIMNKKNVLDAGFDIIPD